MSQSVISKATAVEVKAQTIEGRRLHHGPSGNSPRLFHTPDLSGPKLSHLCWLPTLRGLADQASTAEEVRQLLMDIEGRQAAIDDIVQALEALVAQQRVRKNEIEGQQWYNMRKRRLGFLRE